MIHLFTGRAQSLGKESPKLGLPSAYILCIVSPKRPKAKTSFLAFCNVNRASINSLFVS